MKRAFVLKSLLLALAISPLSCSGGHDQRRQIAVPSLNKQSVPSSERSREVVARTAPYLAAELQDRNLEYGAPIFIRVFKKERDLEVWLKNGREFELFRTYHIAAMSGSLGPKLREGDFQAPEGFYFVPPSRMNPHSSFHLSFNLGYPNTYDRAHGRTGSALMVHGSWASAGCFAMTDSRIEEIYTLADAALRNGQKFFRVHCFPFRMTERNMQKHRKGKWAPFWQQLHRGYEFFEKTGQPPDVLVRNRRYVFEKDRG